MVESSKQVVLVVEDEPLLRMAAVDLVEQAGFEVVEATDATNAVSILETRPDIRIVFTDIDMPRGMDGMKLAALVRDRWPPIEIIIVSGHLEKADVELPAPQCVLREALQGTRDCSGDEAVRGLR